MKRTRLVAFLSCIVVALATIICRCNADTFATRLSAGGVSDHLMLREGGRGRLQAVQSGQAHDDAGKHWPGWIGTRTSIKSILAQQMCTEAIFGTFLTHFRHTSLVAKC